MINLSCSLKSDATRKNNAMPPQGKIEPQGIDQTKTLGNTRVKLLDGIPSRRRCALLERERDVHRRESGGHFRSFPHHSKKRFPRHHLPKPPCFTWSRLVPVDCGNRVGGAYQASNLSLSLSFSEIAKRSEKKRKGIKARPNSTSPSQLLPQQIR